MRSPRKTAGRAAKRSCGRPKARTNGLRAVPASETLHRGGQEERRAARGVGNDEDTELVAKTLAVFEPLYGRSMTEGEAVEIIQNVRRFFGVLAGWGPVKEEAPEEEKESA